MAALLSRRTRAQNYSVCRSHFSVSPLTLIIWLLTRIAQTTWAPLLLTVITGIGAITSAVLLVYAQLVIQATCRWCVASGIAMAVLFALSLYIYRRGKNLPAIPIGTVWWLSTAIVFALRGLNSAFREYSQTLF